MASLITDARSVSTFLYGRRTYETMAGWETDPSWADVSPESANFAALWTRADRVVFSHTLTEVSTTRTRIEPQFTIEAVERARSEASGDLTVESPTLAAEAFRLGLIDAVELLLCPVLVGRGMRVFPDDVRLDLRLARERRFENGMVQVTYERDSSR